MGWPVITAQLLRVLSGCSEETSAVNITVTMAAVGAPSSASGALLQSRLLQQPAIALGDSTLAMKSLGCCLSDSVHLSTGGAQGEVPCLLLTGAHSRLMIDTQAGGGGFKGVHNLTHTFSGSFM